MKADKECNCIFYICASINSYVMMKLEHYNDARNYLIKMVRGVKFVKEMVRLR